MPTNQSIRKNLCATTARTTTWVFAAMLLVFVVQGCCRCEDNEAYVPLTQAGTCSAASDELLTAEVQTAKPDELGEQSAEDTSPTRHERVAVQPLNPAARNLTD